jgi:hypothetical protein
MLLAITLRLHYCQAIAQNSKGETLAQRAYRTFAFGDSESHPLECRGVGGQSQNERF